MDGLQQNLTKQKQRDLGAPATPATYCGRLELVLHLLLHLPSTVVILGEVDEDAALLRLPEGGRGLVHRLGLV
jgi:hypothetical protein